MGPAATTLEETQSYIVVLKPGRSEQLPDAAADMARQARGSIGFTYSNALRGFSITMPASAAAGLAKRPDVAYVEPDQRIAIDAQSVPTGIDRVMATSNTSIDIDDLDDHRVDADVAILDTGIDTEHPELVVAGGVTCVETGGTAPGSSSASCSPGGDDDHYHGTHVAGIVGALDNDSGVVGVAPGVRLWAVKVLDDGGEGTLATALAGIDWVVENAGTIDVANMSFSGLGYSQALYDSIQGMVEAGVATAVAAGNDDADAGQYSPASFDTVLTVSAIADFDGSPGGIGASSCAPGDQDDTLADFSNWGSAIDIAAPGACIRSTVPVERGSYATASGTSMASPHVAGALALAVSTDPATTESEVRTYYDRVLRDGSSDWTDDSGDGIQEPLLDVRSIEAATIQGPDTGSETAADFVGLVPARLLDSRVGFATVDGLMAGVGKVPARGTLRVPVAGRGGVPADAAAVVVNVTVTRPEGAGYATVFPSGVSRPVPASNVNFVAGQTVPNLVVVPVGADGSISIYSHARADVIADVSGYFQAGSDFGGLVPARLLDSRVGFATVDGLMAGVGKVPARGTLRVPVAGRGGVPADAAAVVVNVTVTRPEGAGYATVFPSGVSRPVPASNVNFVAGQTVPNLVVVPVGADGSISIYSHARADVIADVSGYFVGP